ncbi:MAG: glycosyltransferase family 4 protein [Acetobacterales bacterium]
MAASRVLCIGPHPPPVHGQATINAAMGAAMRGRGLETVVLDTAAPSLDRRWRYRLGRLPRIAGALLRGSLLLAGGRAGAVYMSVSGGRGQGYEIAFALMGRLFGANLVLHHHSFAYVDRRSRMTALLTRVAGSRALHVTLCRCMAERFRAHYPAARRVLPLSNAVVLGAGAGPARVRDRVAGVGMLGNLSAEKGVFDVLDLAEELARRDVAVRLRLAGPFPDAATAAAVRARAGALQHVELVGPVYGEDKDRFLEGIDVLLFPSRYRDEAEPLVVHEAMVRGVPVIAADRGCIAELVGGEAGLVVPMEEFVEAAAGRLALWASDPDALAAASRAATARFRELLARDAAGPDAVAAAVWGTNPAG